MKIIAIRSEQGLEKDKEYDLCQMSAETVIRMGIAKAIEPTNTVEIPVGNPNKGKKK
jgi:hypothetical protein